MNNTSDRKYSRQAYRKRTSYASSPLEGVTLNASIYSILVDFSNHHIGTNSWTSSITRIITQYTRCRIPPSASISLLILRPSHSVRLTQSSCLPRSHTQLKSRSTPGRQCSTSTCHSDEGTFGASIFPTTTSPFVSRPQKAGKDQARSAVCSATLTISTL